MRKIEFYFDFISPYSWFALRQAGSFSETHNVHWCPRPVVLGALLSHHGLVGPVETPAKRHYSLHDVSRLAHKHGLQVEGPPRHPFRSLDALRAVVLFQDDPKAMELTVALAGACWERGVDLEDRDVLAATVRTVGLDATDFAARVEAAEVKNGLREITETAISHGVFGVPTFRLGDDLFWGHDRMDQLAEALDGIPPVVKERAARLLTRPVGVRRRR